MKFNRHLISAIIILTVTVVMSGCTKPPDEEKSLARTSMNSAVTKGADKYAAVELDIAKKIWDTAESQMQEKKYKEARQSYMDAKAAMDKAVLAAEAGKKAAIAAVNTDIVTLEESWKNLRLSAIRFKKKMKSEKAAWTADSTTFTDGLKMAKDKVVADPAWAKVKLGELNPIIKKWEAIFQKMSASDKKELTKKKAKHKKKSKQQKKKNR